MLMGAIVTLEAPRLARHSPRTDTQVDHLRVERDTVQAGETRNGGAMTEPPATVTVAEAARRLQVQPRTVYRLLARGELHGVRLGRRWRIPLDELKRAVTATAGAAGGTGNGRTAAGPPPIVRVAERMRPLMERSS